MNPSEQNQPSAPQGVGAAMPAPAAVPAANPAPPQAPFAAPAPAYTLPPQAAAPTYPVQQPQYAPAPQMPQQYAPQTAEPMNQQPGMQYAPAPPQMAPPPVAVKPNPNSTQNSLEIAEIRDGIVIMNDGSFRSVIMVKSINFDLMSPQEREAVEYSYQGFLNSLYFPVQIFIRSQKVDLRPYIEKLDKIRTEHDNMLLALLMEDYLAYIDNLALQTNIMDKKFYVVIPFFPTADVQKALAASKGLFSGAFGLFKNEQKHVTINEIDLEKAKTELRNRVQAVLGGLLQSGVQGLPLDTQELIELYYDTYNPDTATRQELKNFDDLTAPIITKGQGPAPQPGLEPGMS
jgi:hypothetical protein